MRKIIVFGVALFITLTIFSGCRWFADNPMFPTAKIAVESNRSYVPQQDGDKQIKDVTFTFTPLNRVGAELTSCTVTYRTTGGTVIHQLTKTWNLHITVIPPDTPMGEYAYPTDYVRPEVTLEIFDPKVEGYLLSQGINQARAEIAFSGKDLAGHAVTFRKEIGITAFTGIIQDDIKIEAFCSEEDIAISVVVNNPARVERVEFFINDQPAGVVTSPPFISDRVSFVDNGCPGNTIGGCPSASVAPKTVVATVVVHDVLGNVTTKNKEIDIDDCIRTNNNNNDNDVNNND